MIGCDQKLDWLSQLSLQTGSNDINIDYRVVCSNLKGRVIDIFVDIESSK